MRLPRSVSLEPRLALLLGVALLSLLSGCSVELQHDLSEDDANDIYVLLQGEGCEPKKVKEEGAEGKYVISVPKPLVARAAALLRDNVLPRPQADGLSVFKKMKGMIPTATEERAMLLEALGGEVSNALNKLPGVLEARTIVNIPETNDLTQPDKKPATTVSVFVKFRDGGDGKPPDKEMIKDFVSTAIPELKRDNVQVMMVRAATSDEHRGAQMSTVTILGIDVTQGSADTLKGLIATAAIAVFLMAGLTVFAFMRKPAPPRRTRTNVGAGEG